MKEVQKWDHRCSGSTRRHEVNSSTGQVPNRSQLAELLTVEVF